MFLTKHMTVGIHSMAFKVMCKCGSVLDAVWNLIQLFIFSYRRIPV